MISLGDTDVEYNNKFRLYLTTELSNPDFKADAATKVNLINFTVTRRGLEEQLLGAVSVEEVPGRRMQGGVRENCGPEMKVREVMQLSKVLNQTRRK